MKTKTLVASLLAFMILVSISACGGGGGYKDGTYEGEYVSDQNNNSTKVTITITEGEIAECKAKFFDSSGNEKDENYGLDLQDAQKQKAQIAYKGMKQYADLLVEAGNLDDIDAVSGATVSFKEFQEAVKDALSKAK